jgi:hypothetical protein
MKIPKNNKKKSTLRKFQTNQQKKSTENMNWSFSTKATKKTVDDQTTTVILRI